jgi:hypothetical protein
MPMAIVEMLSTQGITSDSDILPFMVRSPLIDRRTTMHRRPI